jgi:hypothetical protein
LHCIAGGVADEEELEGLLVYLVTDEKGMQFLLPSGLLPTTANQ